MEILADEDLIVYGDTMRENIEMDVPSILLAIPHGTSSLQPLEAMFNVA